MKIHFNRSEIVFYLLDEPQKYGFTKTVPNYNWFIKFIKLSLLQYFSTIYSLAR